MFSQVEDTVYFSGDFLHLLRFQLSLKVSFFASKKLMRPIFNELHNTLYRNTEDQITGSKHASIENFEKIKLKKKRGVLITMRWVHSDISVAHIKIINQLLTVHLILAKLLCTVDLLFFERTRDEFVSLGLKERALKREGFKSGNCLQKYSVCTVLCFNKLNLKD